MDKATSADYKLTQVFGDKTAAEKVSEEDIISAVKFDQSGKYLSLGDRAGRLIIFDAQQPKGKKHLEYSYYTEVLFHSLSSNLTSKSSTLSEASTLRSASAT